MAYKDPERQRAYAREWLKRNPQKARDAVRRWNKSHPEQRRAAKRLYYARHRERHKAVMAAYHRAHPEVLQARAALIAHVRVRQRATSRAQSGGPSSSVMRGDARTAESPDRYRSTIAHRCRGEGRTRSTTSFRRVGAAIRRRASSPRRSSEHDSLRTKASRAHRMSIAAARGWVAQSA